MAATSQAAARLRGDERFFLVTAIVMTLTLVAGFSIQLAAGRSTFAAPWPVHVHALLFFGWTAFFMTQIGLAATGSVAMHRRLGWLALALIPAMVAVGTATTVRMVRHGTVPFFFTPGYFLIMDPLTVIVFGGLALWAIRLRRRSDWHRRLMICAMAMIMGPGFGRILPMPLLPPYAGLISVASGGVFMLAGAIADRRRDGRVHPAWLWGMGVLAGSIAFAEIVGKSEAAASLVRFVAQASPGESVPPLAYPPPPTGPLVTGR